MTDTPILDWTDDGHPRSRVFGDIYFSPEDGLGESRAVFLDGCGLPAAWAGRRQYVVGELGFGAGLNILALMDLWRREGPPDGRLSVFSIEAYPVEAADMLRAVARWPEIADLAQMLAQRWPGRARGFHRVEFPELRVVLDLAVMPVEAALEAWGGRADAWFLDGFSPALNPQMWSPEVMAKVAARSAPGARAATFTVAGAVRRGLQVAGFEVEKRPGFGRKRERLAAWLPGVPADAPKPSVAVVGAGIAGASALRALAALGVEAVLIEADAPGAGGSGNPAGLVTPRLDAGLGPVAELGARTLARARALYETVPGAVIARGVRQLAVDDRDAVRFEKIAASDLFEPGEMTAGDGLEMSGARVVSPRAVLAAWAAEVVRARVAAVVRDGGAWRLADADGAEIWRGDAVILANGPDLARLWPQVELTPIRGQASWIDGLEAVEAAAWGGYVVPTGQGVLFGATHDREDTGTEVRAEDHRRNLETLAQARPDLASGIDPEKLQGRASLRAASPDRLPLAGALADGLYALGGFGSRGLAMAPLLAEHVAASIAGAPSPLPRQLSALVDPERFRIRAMRKGRISVATSG
ncbi:tRNA (5-methylaminomethyl-2-thiouridine)(34)-methyltransferase MnmD [Phenylobacterium sp.]|uniref:tRNA (5-methylaminomethyl-2-thiouridine)(34)-methyltransferase MnmD n=1 Tax=Phenylobacterium sp. TaxID=1871053 RepID=UPI0035AEE5B0